MAKAIVGCKIWFPHGSVGSSPTTRTICPNICVGYSSDDNDIHRVVSAHTKIAFPHLSGFAPVGWKNATRPYSSQTAADPASKNVTFKGWRSLRASEIRCARAIFPRFSSLSGFP